MRKKGFTIIELLVVVAIIALLTAVVVIAIDVYRARGSNASIQATLGQTRSEVALYRENNDGSYEGLCDPARTGDFRIHEQYIEARLQSGGGDHLCFSDTNAWVMAVELKGSSGSEFAWCVDSTNFGGPISAARFGSLSATTLCQ